MSFITISHSLIKRACLIVKSSRSKLLHSLSLIGLILLSSCATAPSSIEYDVLQSESTLSPEQEIITTPLPTRPPYSPGELVDYEAQTGDNLPALAVHFNTTEQEIRAANPILPEEVTTLPPGLPMQIPIYYNPLWGSSFKILPDGLFPNGPAQVGFNAVDYVNSMPGWLKHYEDIAGGMPVRGGELVNIVATNFSISPRLLLAIIEYQTGALTETFFDDPDNPYLLGYRSISYRGLYQQLIWAANTLNNGYYGWRTGRLPQFRHTNGALETPDPWQNAASVAIQYYFANILSVDSYKIATHGEGLLKTYAELFGDPWQNPVDHIEGSLQQPEFLLPFLPGNHWAYTGGPHTGWGTGDPFAAIDFAPPNIASGCAPAYEYATAIANGVISRTDTGVAILDLDGDGDERTGWSMLYLHLATATIPPTGTVLNAGDPIGLPSCEGGKTTGTHIHIARKYNGEWIAAAGAVPFNLEGWIAGNGNKPYLGTLVKFGRTVQACECSDQESQIQATKLNTNPAE